MSGWNRAEDLDALEEIGAHVIGATVLRARLGLGMSQRQLAWRVGLAQSTISRVERGTLRGIGFKRLSAIVAVLSNGRDIRFAEGPRAPQRRLPGQEVSMAANDLPPTSPFL